MWTEIRISVNWHFPELIISNLLSLVILFAILLWLLLLFPDMFRLYVGIVVLREFQPRDYR
jgi:hypothetical protein